MKILMEYLENYEGEYMYLAKRMDNKNGIMSHTQLKIKLLKERNNLCAMCNKEFKKHNLVLDHIFPLCLGGEQTDENNLQLLCEKCNNEKTNIDKLIINIISKMGFKRHDMGKRWIILLDKKETIEIYSFLYNFYYLNKDKIIEYNKRDDKWFIEYNEITKDEIY